jgi:hypothetical protein
MRQVGIVADQNEPAMMIRVLHDNIGTLGARVARHRGSL